MTPGADDVTLSSHSPAVEGTGRRARRGRHKVFLGMAAGVGKTYRMLGEGKAEAEAGRDVVVGYLESHGRRDGAVAP